MKRIFLPLIVTAVLLSMTSAKAFYDPNVGRWINRDPIGERGGINLYGFVRNNPLRFVDTDGRDIYGMPHPSGEEGIGIFECGNRIKDEVWAEYGIGAPKHDPNDRSARVAHCVAHCRIKRECPGGGGESWLGGFGKEVIDQIKKWVGKGGDGYDSGDMNANALGRRCGKKQGSCEEQCQDAYKNGELK